MNEIFTQERLNDLLEEDLIFSANILYKIINGELIQNESCLGDWLEYLEDDELKILVDYFNKITEDEFDKLEEFDENLITKDLANCMNFLYILESGNGIEIDNEEKIEETLRFFDICCNIDVLRREGLVDIVEKPRISNESSGIIQNRKLKKKRQ